MANFFSNAKDFFLDRPTMNSVQGDQHNHITTYISDSSEKGKLLDTLKPADRSRFYIKPCMEGTRKSIFDNIQWWLADRNAKNILWISGSPGAGKSAIASSLVLKLAEDRFTNASFFFKRGDAVLSDPGVVWRTISSDLCAYDPGFADAVVKNLETRLVDPARPDIASHFRHLIQEPLASSSSNDNGATSHIVVLDALDECGLGGYPDDQRQIFLRTLHRWASLDRRFRLIVTGRDDRMPDFFRNVCERMELQSGNDVGADTDKDIRLFFAKRFEELDTKPSARWPGPDVINHLTERAAGLFIWAETVMKFVHQDIPEKQLQQVLGGRFGGGEDTNDLYTQILIRSFKGVPRNTLKSAQAILKVIILARTPLFYDDLPYIVPEVETSAISFILSRLSSVISTRGARKQLSISHLSFAEFLCDSLECPAAFAIDPYTGNLQYALTCFRIMKQHLRFNICGLETSYLSNDAVPDISQRVQDYIPSFLAYSCRFWAPHMLYMAATDDSIPTALLAEIRTFFSQQFLFWLEVMSLLKMTSEARDVLASASTWLKTRSAELSSCANDLSRFVSYFHEPISWSVPHIYISALPFTPTESWVYQQYRKQYPRTLSITAGADQNWPACIRALTGHKEGVQSVAYSPDGRQAVSGSYDRTICVWDVQTAQIIAGPLELPHSDARYSKVSVRFSRDGKYVLGCNEVSLSVWNVETSGLEFRTSWIQDESVYSIDISPDGGMVAYGCSDGKISLFNAIEGRLTTKFRDGNGVSASISFSPDGKRLASGSSDCSVRVWDILRGNMIAGPFQTHENWIYSVAFSHDGTKVASGSLAVSIWDINRNEIFAGPYVGGSLDIQSVCFSPDDALVICGSRDQTIRVLSVNTGAIVAGPFQGHIQSISTLHVSPDGLNVISASGDGAILIWDVKSGVSPSHSDYHTSNLNSVCFSPDETKIASSAYDKTIRTWDVSSGRMLVSIAQDVRTICFSPDGRTIVSGTWGGDIHIHDAANGMTVSSFYASANGDPSNPILSIAISRDSGKIACGHYRGQIQIRNPKLRAMAVISTLQGHTDQVTSVAFSPNGSRLASASEDKTIRVWDPASGRVVLGPLQGHTDKVSSVCYSKNGAYIISGSHDCTVCVWDASTGLLHAGPFHDNQGWVEFVDISGDGTVIVAGLGRGAIIVRFTSGGEIVGMIEGAHSGRVASLMLSRDGKKLVSGSEDGVHVWSLKSWRTTDGLDISEDRANVLNPIIGDQLFSCRSVETHGWVMSKRPAYRPSMSDNCLFWVPPGHRHILCDMDTFGIMGSRRTQVHFGNFVHGKSWTKCRA